MIILADDKPIKLWFGSQGYCQVPLTDFVPRDGQCHLIDEPVLGFVATFKQANGYPRLRQTNIRLISATYGSYDGEYTEFNSFGQSMPSGVFTSMIHDRYKGTLILDGFPTPGWDFYPKSFNLCKIPERPPHTEFFCHNPMTQSAFLDDWEMPTVKRTAAADVPPPSQTWALETREVAEREGITVTQMIANFTKGLKVNIMEQKTGPVDCFYLNFSSDDKGTVGVSINNHFVVLR